MSRDFIRSVLNDNPALFRRVYAFNCDLLNVHPDHLPQDCPPALRAAVAQSPRGRRALSSLIRSRQGLPSHGTWDFADLPSRLALLSREEFEHLVPIAGVAILHPAIARAIDRETVTRCKSCLGAELYRFAVKRAPFLLVKIAAHLPYLPLESDIMVQADRLGKQSIARCLEGQSADLNARVRLMFQGDYRSEAIGQLEMSGDHVWFLLKQILTKEINSGLKACLS